MVNIQSVINLKRDKLIQARLVGKKYTSYFMKYFVYVIFFLFQTPAVT